MGEMIRLSDKAEEQLTKMDSLAQNAYIKHLALRNKSLHIERQEWRHQISRANQTNLVVSWCATVMAIAFVSLCVVLIRQLT